MLVDDSLEIAQECAQYGILTYHISLRQDTFRPTALWEIGFQSHSFTSFASAIYEFLNDLFTGALGDKLAAIEAKSSVCRVPNVPGN